MKLLFLVFTIITMTSFSWAQDLSVHSGAAVTYNVIGLDHEIYLALYEGQTESCVISSNNKVFLDEFDNLKSLISQPGENHISDISIALCVAFVEAKSDSERVYTLKIVDHNDNNRVILDQFSPASTESNIQKRYSYKSKMDSQYVDMILDINN